VGEFTGKPKMDNRACAGLSPDRGCTN
jgi:hypothetical protein